MKKTYLFISLLLLVMMSCNQEQENQERLSPGSIPDVSLTAEEIQNGILTPEVLWKFGRVSDPQISPNKKQVLFNVSYYSLEDNRGYTNIFLKNLESDEEPQRLTGGEFSYFNHRWIDDNRFAFLSTETETIQVWTANIDGTDKKQVSNFDKSVNAFKISPKGDKFMYFADVKLDMAPQEIHADLPKLDAIFAEDLMYRHWNDWHDYSYSHIFIADFNDDSLTNSIDIMEGEKFDAPMSPYFDDAEVAWSPDGSMIAYTCKKMTGKEYAVSTDSDIYLYKLADKTTHNITKGMLGYDKYPVFSPNSEKLLWMSMETPGYEADKERLFMIDLTTNHKEEITANFDYNVSNPIWDLADNSLSTIYFISCINATHQVFSINTDTKEVIQITEGHHDFTGIEQLNDNSFIATKMSISMATEIFELDKNGNEKQISFINKNIYDNIKMGEAREKWVTTTDNKQMLVWEILPPNFDSTKVYPAILYCQGGPQSAVSQFFSYRWNFQIMAANGYVVIAPNRRGVPGFGTEWNAQISGDYGGQNMKDYLSAVESVKKESFVDEDRIGAVGASYGGFSIFWLAGHNENNLFKAFISHCGMFNLESQYLETEEMFFVNHDLGGPYWDKSNKIAQNSFANSPHRFVDKWNTPILIFAGEYDFRIPYTESMQAFNAAQLRGIDSKLVIFPKETHFVLKPQNSVAWQREFKNWLDKYLK